MSPIKLSTYAAIVVACSGSAQADETVTVQSLLKQDFAIVGAIASAAGPGLFLQKKDQLFVCFVSETPNSPAVTTRYCKPVH
jgi:hypothetical protein